MDSGETAVETYHIGVIIKMTKQNSSNAKLGDIAKLGEASNESLLLRNFLGRVHSQHQIPFLYSTLPFDPTRYIFSKRVNHTGHAVYSSYLGNLGTIAYFFQWGRFSARRAPSEAQSEIRARLGIQQLPHSRARFDPGCTKTSASGHSA
jgi:hypothetical protein